MTDLENREAFKAWFKKEYLGIDALADQGDEGAMIRRDYAYVGYQAAKAESHKQAALYQFEINHLAQANEQWREKAAKAQVVPEGFVLVPRVATKQIVNAGCCLMVCTICLTKGIGREQSLIWMAWWDYDRARV